MASELDHLTHEMAGLVSRIEQMERDRKRENRTPGGLIVPDGVKVEKENMEEVQRQIGSLHRRLNGIDEVQARMMKVLERQQAAIEELAVFGNYQPENA